MQTKLQNKPSKVCFEMMEKFELIDIWRNVNGNATEHTYLSERHRSFSRIDIFWISKKLAICISKNKDTTKHVTL